MIYHTRAIGLSRDTVLLRSMKEQGVDIIAYLLLSYQVI